MKIKNYTIKDISYTLFRPEKPTNSLIVFVPGMACNRFGSPVHKEPRHAVRTALTDIAKDTCFIIFPDINKMAPHKNRSDKIPCVSIEQQVHKLDVVIRSAYRILDIHHTTFVAQSLGSLTVALFAQKPMCHQLSANCILWGPPTHLGPSHKIRIVSVFSRNKLTSVDKNGDGDIQFGDGKLLHVTKEYWNSINRNSLKIHASAMARYYQEITAFYASDDHIYPDSKTYLSKHLPSAVKIEIKGRSHTFKTKAMQSALKAKMKKLLPLNTFTHS